MCKISSTLKIILVLSILLVSTNSYAQLFGFGGGATKKVEVGGDAPEFKGVDFLTKKAINFNELKGNKVILLDFWSIYCVSCLQEIPKLIDIYNKYKDRDIFFIGMNLDTNTRRLKMYLKNPQKVPPYPIVMDKPRTIANAYKVNILPTTIIIGKDGKIKMYHEGYKPGDEDDIDKIIDKLTK